MNSFAGAALTKFHILDGLDQQMYCLAVLETRDTKPRCPQGPLKAPGKALFQASLLASGHSVAVAA